MGDEEVTMILAAETARNRRMDDVRRRPRPPGDNKTTQTVGHFEGLDIDELLVKHISLIDRGNTLLSYMAFSLVIGTLCQFKCFVTMKTEHPNYMYILVFFILTLTIHSIVAVILLYTSKRETTDAESTTTFYLTLLIAIVTFINIAVFILV